MSSKPKILITHCEIPLSSLNILKDKYDFVTSPGLPYPGREQLIKDIQGVVGVLLHTNLKFDRELVDAAGPQLKVVGSMYAGYDNIDVELLKSRNIKVSNAPNVGKNCVAEVAIGLLLMTSHKLLEGYKAIVNGDWGSGTGRPLWMSGHGLDHSTVGIIGLGAIGLAIAKRIKAFEVSRILYSGRTEKEEGKALGAEFVTMDSLVRQSDFVIVACALTDQTRHLINADLLGKMKSNCILINISRGGVINQDDLVNALRKGVIWGAGLDVMSPEPLPPDHPLTTLPNCVLSPHLGTSTMRAIDAMASLAARNIYNALNDLPLITPI